MTIFTKAAAGVAFAAALAITCAAAAAAQQPEIRQFPVVVLESLGRALFAQDREAWIATDVLFAQKLDLSKENMAGWIVEPTGDGDRVKFVRKSGDGIEAAYDITFDAAGKPSFTVPADRKLSEDALAQFTARQTALKTVGPSCAENYNVVVLRDPETQGWLVWALAATTRPKVVVVGGHYRFTVSADGRELLRRDALSAGCMEMPFPERSKDTVAMAVTSVVAATPIETHIYLSLANRLPLYVGVSSGTWRVEDGKMTKVK